MLPASLLLLLALQAPPPNAAPCATGDAGCVERDGQAADAQTAANGQDAPAPQRWELGTLDVVGTTPKPGVIFLEAETERLRAVMQSLVAQTRAGGLAEVEVSRPVELVERAPVVRHIETRGLVKEGAVLRALEPSMATLDGCRLAARPRLPTDIRVALRLHLDEQGQVSRAKLTATSPPADRVGHCVVTRLKRATWPASAAGGTTVELEVVLPAPLAPATPPAPAP